MKIINLIAVGSAAADQTTPYLDLGDLKSYGIQVIFTDVVGTLVGSLKLQSSMQGDYWNDVADSTQAISTTGDYSHTWSADAELYRLVRVAWDYTSGAGNIRATGLLKETPKGN